MSATYHFISGLPRAGSTLLSAILLQNPRFLAGVSSPVASFIIPLVATMNNRTEFAAFYTDERRRSVLRSIFDGYYVDPDRRPVIFDTNRLWCGKIELLADLFPRCRVIVCVREIGWIINSIERVMKSNPLHLSGILDPKTRAGTLYAREEALMDNKVGFIGGAYANVREAFCGEHSLRLLIVSYEGLTADPTRALRRLYDALEQPQFEHDFNRINFQSSEYDETLGLRGLHEVELAIRAREAKPCIPPDIIHKWAEASFWNQLVKERRDDLYPYPLSGRAVNSKGTTAHPFVVC